MIPRNQAHRHAALLGEPCEHCQAQQAPLVALPNGGYIGADEEPWSIVSIVAGVIGVLCFGVIVFVLVTSL